MSQSPEVEGGFKPPLEEFPLSIRASVTFDGQPAMATLAIVDFNPDKGFTFRSLGDLRYIPQEASHRFETRYGQHLMLFNERDMKVSEPWTHIKDEWWFEFGLHQNAPWDEQILVDRWRMPCTTLIRQLGAKPLELTHLPSGGLQIKADDKVIHEYKLPLWRATGRLVLRHHWSIQQWRKSEIEPQVLFEMQYSREVPFEKMRLHEDSIRNFFNSIWMLRLSVPEVGLWRGDQHTMFYRWQPPSIDRDAWGLFYDRKLILVRMEKWLDRWCRSTTMEYRAYHQALKVYSSKDLSIDLQLAMMIHALEALDHTERGAMRIGTRFNVHLSKYWARGHDIPKRRARAYMDKLIFTRNEIIHVQRHPKSSYRSLLHGVQRTKALFEVMAVFRSMFLKKMGESDEVAEDYLRRTFKRIDEMSFRYF